MPKRAATSRRAARSRPRRTPRRTPRIGEIVEGDPDTPAVTTSRPLPPSREPIVIEDGTAQSEKVFGPGSRLRAVIAVEGTRSDFYTGFMASGTMFLLFQAAAPIGAGVLGCRTGRSTEEETALRATLPLPEGEHEYAIGWGEREVVWSIDGKVVARHRARYAGPPHHVVVRAAGGTRALVRELDVDGVAMPVQRP